MFSFFKKKPAEPVVAAVSVPSANPAQEISPAVTATANIPPAVEISKEKVSWFARLKKGLAKTSSNLTTLFIGARIDDDLYDELESALLMSDAGVEATMH